MAVIPCPQQHPAKDDQHSVLGITVDLHYIFLPIKTDNLYTLSDSLPNSSVESPVLSLDSFLS